MDGRDLTAAVMSVVLVAARVILATVIMNRVGDVLSVVAAPETAHQRCLSADISPGPSDSRTGVPISGPPGRVAFKLRRSSVRSWLSGLNEFP